jgi:hypothetical protein
MINFTDILNSQRVSLEEKVIHCYIDTIISTIGFILSILTITILSGSMFKEKIYSFIRIEMACSGLTVLFYAFRSTLFCGSYQMGTYALQLFNIIVRYCRFLFENSSILFGIISSIKFYCMISNLDNSKYNIFTIISHKSIFAFVILTNSVLFVYLGFERDILSITSLDNNLTLFYQQESMFAKTKFHEIWRVGSLFIVDIVFVLVLVITNVLTLIQIKRILRNRRNIIASQNNIKNTKIKRTIRLMVLFGSLNIFISRIPIIIFIVLTDILNYKRSNSSLLRYISYIVYSFASISFSIKFILIYATNGLFRKVSNKLFSRFLDYLSRIK